MHLAAKQEILLEKLNEWYEEDAYPPESDEIEGVLLVKEEFIEGKRWGTLNRWIYQLDGEQVFAAVEDVEPATEMQSWGDYGPPQVYPVTAHEEVITVTRYRRTEPN